MRSIWQKQSGGLFRSKCLIFLCSITHFCRWSSRNVLLPFLFIYKISTCDTRLQMRSIWQKQSRGLFRSKCLIFL